MWVLGTKLPSSTRAMYALNPGAISPAPLPRTQTININANSRTKGGISSLSSQEQIKFRNPKQNPPSLTLESILLKVKICFHILCNQKWDGVFINCLKFLLFFCGARNQILSVLRCSMFSQHMEDGVGSTHVQDQV